MNESYDLNSILDAIENINNKQIEKISSNTINNTKKLSDSIIPPDVDRLIKEAEAYKNKVISKPNSKSLNSHNENSEANNKYFNNFKEIQSQMLEDLYFKLSKRIKKNTLKIIFNLHLKIQDLEKKIENSQVKKNQPIDKDRLILKEEVVASSKIFDPSIDRLNKTVSNMKEILQPIYNRVERQKKSFLALKEYTLKLLVDKEAVIEKYENLIIKNKNL